MNDARSISLQYAQCQTIIMVQLGKYQLEREKKTTTTNVKRNFRFRCARVQQQCSEWIVYIGGLMDNVDTERIGDTLKLWHIVIWFDQIEMDMPTIQNLSRPANAVFFRESS